MIRIRNFASIALACATTCAIAQAPQQTKATAKADAKPDSKSVAKPASSPTGPTGFGGIKIGMTKKEIEAMPESELVRLAAEMKLKEPKAGEEVKPDEEEFDVIWVVPNAPQNFKGSLTFRKGRLLNIYVNFDESEDTYQAMVKQISQRYGKGKVDDGIKDEDCIYKNGSSFKIKRGIMRTTWTQAVARPAFVETSLGDINLTSCPSRLTDGLFEIKLKTLSIELKDKQPAPVKNLF